MTQSMRPIELLNGVAKSFPGMQTFVFLLFMCSLMIDISFDDQIPVNPLVPEGVLEGAR